MVKAVIFDLYETLVTQSGVEVPRAGALGPALGLEPDAYRRAWKRLRPRVLRGDLTFSEALIRAGAELGVEIGADRIHRASVERARANAAVFENPAPDVVELTRDLAASGVRLATISNCI